ncbi:acyl carrier protein [Actinacidiphila sp. DG2A-62]|uniref:acyl carrier protein n=1 Tax=Actinacidiphila sp. DG2A-62 TaxID=3108821 RepID=UPI002DBEEE7E|nr:acyl carrier protein [Actinacidiphila sp. DG2A-62]MEC3993096.1 acyl carrier protein [Actinacidiphila sp. DG2A-62]
MDTATSSNFSRQVLAAVLDAARQAHGGDVDADLDPISAGFDSIAAVEMAGILEEAFDVECTMVDVFDVTSLGELADLLVQRIDAASGR